MTRDTYRITLIVLGVIIIGGFYLRIESIRGTEVTHPLGRDAKAYFMYAYNMRHKYTYSQETVDPENKESPVTPDAVRSPGYPLFLALFVDGLPDMRMIHGILVAQTIMSTFTIFAAFMFFQSFIGKRWGAVATLLVALSPHLIVFNSYLLTETLFCFMIVAGAWLVSRFVAKPSVSLALFCGGVIGTANLVRPTLLYFNIVMALYLWVHYGRKKGTRFFVMVLLGFALTYSPWIARNLKTLKITTDKRLMINFLHHGMYPDFTFDEVAESFGSPYRYDPRSNEIGKSVGSVLKEIIGRFHREPWRHLKWFLIKKPVVFWSWSMVQGGDVFVYKVSRSPFFTESIFRWTYHLMHVLHKPLVFLGFLGSLLAWLPLSTTALSKNSIHTVRFAALILIYYTIIHMTGVPLPRYSVPLRPFLYGVALYPFCLLHLVSFKFFKRAYCNQSDNLL